MLINKNSQLGLRFEDLQIKMGYLQFSKDDYNLKVKKLEDLLETTDSDQDMEVDFLTPNCVDFGKKLAKLEDHKINTSYLITENDNKNYLICHSVHEASDLIKIKENFTGRTLKDIKFGKYTYLLGKNEMVRFACSVGYITGFYFNSENKVTFDFAVLIEDGDFHCDAKFSKEFTKIMKILTFVELGDIEVIELKGGQNNGGQKDKDKITNRSNNTIYVVDSNWNKLVIRTEGFAVRGHFRLQSCGQNLADRKLIWIDAFEKHGYVRKPKAELVR